ncbi:MAG: DUF4143 domain-containing protein [Bifidobacteriaceae bacterium]|jgi:predicted AAA+ superfamily ATPase|nr:DUF4143 domain-containing protein [Bifidobacteriaceae bacterium]
MEYQPRIVDQAVRDQLEVAGAIVVKGPKGCGKTETARFHSHSEILIDDSVAVQTAMTSDPTLLLQGATPRLVDEWQEQRSLWNTVRHEVDRRRAKGQFILTGSSTPRDADLAGLHTGVGRFGVVSMTTMSWFERGWSSGEVSLADLLDGHQPQSQSFEPDLPEVAARLVTGGWPGNLDLTATQAQLANANYFQLLTEADFVRAAGGRRNPLRVRRVMRSLARNIATECDTARIAADAGEAARPYDRDAVADYLDTLARLMVQQDLPAWSTHIRSRARLRRSPKRLFCDPSVACMALNLTPAKLMNDLAYMGLAFEAAAIHDLRVYGQAVGGQLYHYRDSSGLEADGVLELQDGSWAAVEVKLGFGAVEEAARNLTALAANIDQAAIGPPRALIVVTGAGFAHQRADGVSVVPLQALRH